MYRVKKLFYQTLSLGFVSDDQLGLLINPNDERILKSEQNQHVLNQVQTASTSLEPSSNALYVGTSTLHIV